MKFSTTKVITRITKAEGEAPSHEVVEALRQFYKLPPVGNLKVSIHVPYEYWDIEDCQIFLEWVESEEEEVVDV